MRLRPETWGKIALGLLVIGGTVAVLWAIYRPTVSGVAKTEPPPPPPKLYDTTATVSVLLPGSGARRRSRIRCDGTRRSATGFWARDPLEACDALASTRSALLAGPGCARTERTRLRLHVVGRFGSRRYEHRAQQFGCPDPRAWLAVNALVKPIRVPEQQLAPAEENSG